MEPGDDVADLDAGDDGASSDAGGSAPAQDLRRARRRRRTVAGVAAGAVALLVVGVVAQRLAGSDGPAGDGGAGGGAGRGAGGGAGLSAAASPTGPPDPGSSAEQLFPVLAGPATTGTGFLGDDLPAELGVVPDSERLLAVTPSSVFWVARADGAVCLLVRDLSTTGGTSGRCASTGEVAADGLTLDAGDAGTAGSGGSSVSAVLLPAGLDGLPLRARGYAEVASGLWLDGATASAVVEAAVDGTSTRIVVVPSESHRGSSDLPEVVTSAGEPYAVVVACLPPAGERPDVEVSVTRGQGPRGAREPVDCLNGTVAHTFAGDGGSARVRVSAPDDLVWAASVVACTGPLSRPTC